METCELLDFGCHLSRFLDVLQSFFYFILEAIMFVPANLLAAIPLPSWATNPTFSLPDGVLWFASVLELPYGASVMASAWGIRFLIRRLPFIG